MSKQSTRHRGSSLGVSFQTINPISNEIQSKNRQILMKTINFNQRQQTNFEQNQQLIGVLPRNLVSPFKWSNRKFLPQLQQKFRYQQTQNRKELKEGQPKIEEKSNYDLSINKIRQVNLTNELQPLLTVRELKGRSYKKRNQLNLTQTKEYRDYPPVQFSARRKFVAPVQLSTYNLEKIFIFKSKDQFIKKILLSMGWKQSRNQNGYTYHLKWISNDTPSDYINTREGQFFNHIRNSDQLTHKSKLTLNLLNSEHIQFYPKTIDLNNNFFDFASEFTDSGILSLLKKYIEHIMIKAMDLFENPKKTQLGILLKQNNFLNIRKDENFTLNVPLLVSLCFHLQKIKRKLQIKYQDQEEFPIEADLTLDTRIIQTILAYNVIPIQEKAQLKKSIDDKILEAHVLQAKYDTPSDDLVSLLVIYYKLFKKKINGFRINGINNLWILKPITTTKNQGIELINKLQSNSSKFRNRIAQKYIQNPLIFKGAKKQNYMWKYVEGKKFDIRQWVLIATQPTRIYKFSSSYLRFCSQNYAFDKQLDQKKNLANYFLNKNRFQSNQQWSILNVQEFFSYLLQIQEIDIQDYFNDQMNHIILETINTVLPKLDLKKNYFQLFGFDLIIDESYKLWLIEVNASPTCEQRTVWLKEMLNNMGTELLRIVLPKQYLYNIKQVKQSKYEWKLLYENGQIMVNQEIYIQNKFKYEQEFENHNKKFQGSLITEVKKKLKAQKLLFNLTKVFHQKFKNKLVEILKNMRPFKHAQIYHYNNISLFIKGIELVIRRHKKIAYKLIKDQYSYNRNKHDIDEIKKTPKDLSIIEIPDLYERFF